MPMVDYITEEHIPETFPSLRNALDLIAIEYDWYGEVLNATLATIIKAQRIIEALRSGERWMVGDELDTALELAMWRLALLLDTHSGHVLDADEWHARLQRGIRGDVIKASGAHTRTPSARLTVIA